MEFWFKTTQCSAFNLFSKSTKQIKNGIWINKKINNFPSGDVYSGGYWTDGTNIYFSYNIGQMNDYSHHYVLNKSTFTLEQKTWNGLSAIDPGDIWTDGTNIYYSRSSNNMFSGIEASHYVLNKSTSTWEQKTWNGFRYFSGYNIWSDGNNIYWSGENIDTQVYESYVLNKSTSTWEQKTWNNVPNQLDGSGIWSDGVNIYFGIYFPSNSPVYILNKNTSTWTYKEMSTTDNSYMYTPNIWSDGINLYKGSGNFPCNTTHNSFHFLTHDQVFTDGYNYYLLCTNAMDSLYILENDIEPIYIKKRLNENTVRWMRQEAYEKQNGEWVKISTREADPYRIL